MDNTTFGNDVPTLPKWVGPPRTIVQVQSILFASLAISLLSALLAMLGKQWLNRYESIDRRGSVIERSQNRQRKLGGIVRWYFDYVMESLPVMLQAGLLLLGCALTRYLWEIDSTITSVILGVTSLGVTFYLFIVIAGTASENCPYQTPAAHISRHTIRHIRDRLIPTLHSTSTAISVAITSNFSRLFHATWSFQLFPAWWSCMRQPWYSTKNILYTLLFLCISPFLPFHDVYCLCRVILRMLVALSKTALRRLTGRHKTAYRLFVNTPLPMLGSDKRTIRLDLQCISWILQTSLDKAVHLSTFKHLISVPELVPFDPTLIMDCFDVFIRCINISDGKVLIVHGLEELATVSADAFYRTLHHLATTNPTSSVLADFQQRYHEVFPSGIKFSDLPFHSTMAKIHALANRFGNPRDIKWHNYRMSIREHVPFARRMAQAAQEGFKQTEDIKVPRWTLRSALYFLSLAPISPTSVVADCLTIIAIDLGCDVTTAESLDERWVQVLWMPAPLTNIQCTSGAHFDSHHSEAQNHG